ncbi:nitric oxide reductase F protein [Aliigemmobacter aestuarii]|uniref:Nitric oxide reductase F protein n=1 Tax=Aliigemmobacter aestuarii TaxID=1445661 RepID=A0A4S3MSH5_9RHOB|nr:nitric oxide reductase F protein [Gemmobacter aestuarii]THD85519.1 nitric oxide reductase F protein [Gemmobacter aestuarii]
MTVTTAWALLIALSAASTLLAASGLQGAAFTVAVLVLAGWKSRLILGRYLGLAVAPVWQRGFDWILALVLILFAVLALAA